MNFSMTLVLAALLSGVICFLTGWFIRSRKSNNTGESFLKTLFKSNKDFDSTFVLAGIVYSYAMLATAVIVLSFLNAKIPAELIDTFEHSKELMLLVAGYFFRKGQEELEKSIRQSNANIGDQSP